MEAVYDEGAQLSYHALVGTRKQSVSDVTQILRKEVLIFSSPKVMHLRPSMWKLSRACDERGLSNAKRRQYNQDLLNYTLDELMAMACQ